MKEVTIEFEDRRMTKHSKVPSPIFWGLALVTVGLLFLLKEIDVLPDIRFWTLVWLALGGWLFVGAIAGKRGWFAPLTLLGLGSLMMLQDLDVIRRFSLWPVIVIGLGLSIMLGASEWRREQQDEDDTSVSWRDL